MIFKILVILGSLVLCAGCLHAPEWPPEQLSDGRTSSTGRQRELGGETYATYCTGCHGDNGDGEGPAARFLDPKPRNLKIGKIKFAAVESGGRPTDDDYLRVISGGLAGTAMPAFPLLSQAEREAVVAYVKTFATQGGEAGKRVVLPPDPFEKDPAKGEKLGAVVYHHLAQCLSCHPSYATVDELRAWSAAAKLPVPSLRADPHDPVTKESQWGADIRAPDFLFDRVKTGTSVESLCRVIGSGIGGTAMPTWSTVLNAEQLWGLAHYVRSLAALRGTPEAGVLRTRLVAQASRTPAPPADRR